MNPPVLRDIHLPDANLWWPPAPGWWIGLSCIVLLALLLPRLWRWARRRPLKRVALKDLERIRQEYMKDQNDRLLLEELSGLLRRVAISYYGRQAAAAVTGEQWQRQLQQLAPAGGFSAEQLEWLARARYRAHADIDTGALLLACEHWLRGLPGSKDRVSA